MPEFVAPQFVKIRTGLLEPKHLKNLGGGSPLVLYLWLQERVHFTGERAGEWLPDEPYRHEDAARELDEPLSSVRRWFYQLVKHGYVVAVRERYGLRLSITKYRPATSRVSVNEHSPINRVPTDEHSAPSRLPTDEHPAPPRVSVNGQSGASRVSTAEQSDPQECPPADTLTDPECSFADSPNATGEHSGMAALKNARAIPTGVNRDSPSPTTATQSTEKESPPPRARDQLDSFNAHLVGLPGYEPSPAFLAKIGAEFGHLDLDLAGMEIRSWFRSKKGKGRECTVGFIRNWLKRDAADAAQEEHRAATAEPLAPAQGRAVAARADRAGSGRSRRAPLPAGEFAGYVIPSDQAV